VLLAIYQLRRLRKGLKVGAEIAIPLQVARFDCSCNEYTADAPLKLELTDSRAVRARAVVVATGARYRRPEIPNLSTFEGAGVSYWSIDDPNDRPACLTHRLFGMRQLVLQNAVDCQQGQSVKRGPDGRRQHTMRAFRLTWPCTRHPLQEHAECTIACNAKSIGARRRFAFRQKHHTVVRGVRDSKRDVRFCHGKKLGFERRSSSSGAFELRYESLEALARDCGQQCCFISEVMIRRGISDARSARHLS
jgi:hypothetical protein